MDSRPIKRSAVTAKSNDLFGFLNWRCSDSVQVVARVAEKFTTSCMRRGTVGGEKYFWTKFCQNFCSSLQDFYFGAFNINFYKVRGRKSADSDEAIQSSHRNGQIAICFGAQVSHGMAI